MLQWFQTILDTAFSNQYKDPSLYHEYAVNLFRTDLAQEIVNIASYFSAKKKRILELGAGTGIVSEKFLQRGFKVTATDADPAMLKVLHCRIPSRHLKIMLLNINSSHWCLKRKYDIVTTLWCNRYIQDIDHFLDRVWRTLNHGGILIWPVFPSETLLWQSKCSFPNLVFWNNILTAVKKRFHIIDILDSQASRALLKPIYIVAQK